MRVTPYDKSQEKVLYELLTEGPVCALSIREGMSRYAAVICNLRWVNGKAPKRWTDKYGTKQKSGGKIRYAIATRTCKQHDHEGGRVIEYIFGKFMTREELVFAKRNDQFHISKSTTPNFECSVEYRSWEEAKDEKEEEEIGDEDEGDYGDEDSSFGLNLDYTVADFVENIS